ncbi:hypothetical protein AKJ66_03760 [candidate division MSBL1 archaeon SCGC-AAA259E22]|uniref:Uncharacterized protein n=1 Tax=candidate division MSBL1 archaeon SCGC-AAA259E22 TaxID=1698265 RepID=A0A133UES1_9EURY|nr:hypothetical protein AKJ66_03760 [candidate division MSBL1 archaeon SCGC-AAA259E22]
MDITAELRFEHYPHCGGGVKLLEPNRKKCEKCGAVYFFCRTPPNGDGKLKIRELDRSEYKRGVEKKVVAARLKGTRRERSEREKTCAIVP